ncbi:MAG TPA: M1 family aminopeptidase [Kofleriaceae bacterium]|nr:M1 family aminopeptidase [Kofleriaceae bacterium]
MRLRAAVLVSSFVAACGGGDDGGGGVDAAVVYPPMADLARDIVDTTLAVDLAARTATATITLAPSSSTGVSFEKGDLTINGVRLGDQPLQYDLSGVIDERLDIGVPPSTEPLVITIDYAWRYHNSSNGVAMSGYTLTWPYHCGNVFPCHSAPSDGTTFHLAVNGAANGMAVYPTEIPGDAPSYMAAWIVGDFQKLDLGTTAAGTRVSMWHRASEASAASAGGAHLRAAFEWMERNLGAYRFGGEVGTVSANWGAGAFGGMEHHPYWHVGAAALGDEGVNVHEAAHGWFGNGVRIECWEDFVLSEGTVEFLMWRVLDEVAGSTVADPLWASLTTEVNAMRSGSGNGVAWPQSCGQVDVLDDGLFSRVPYVKGAFFYRAVEQRVGRAMLDASLRTFYSRYAGQAAGMSDMLDVIEEVTNFDPTACAQSWLVSTTVPAAGPCP